MIFEAANNRYILSSGKTIHANKGILGICPLLSVSEGYDSDDLGEFTPQERAEIADEMIRRWNKWAWEIRDQA